MPTDPPAPRHLSNTTPPLELFPFLSLSSSLNPMLQQQCETRQLLLQKHGDCNRNLTSTIVTGHSEKTTPLSNG